jgi:hypothetical protein
VDSGELPVGEVIPPFFLGIPLRLGPGVTPDFLLSGEIGGSVLDDRSGTGAIVLILASDFWGV